MTHGAFLVQALGEYGGLSGSAVLAGLKQAVAEAVAFGGDNPFYLLGAALFGWFAWSFFFRSS